MLPSRITVLAGGVGGARFLSAVRAWARIHSPSTRITAIVNTGDDMWHVGLRITPDLDSIMYALAGVNDTERGWGRVGESERVSAELREWGAGWPWFTLGDLDLGAHIARSAWLREGVPLSSIVPRLTARWDLGVELLPATDDEVATWVRIDDPEASAAGEPVERTVHFQEWWTRYRAKVVTHGFERRGLAGSSPAAGVLDAIENADVVLLAPSNPVVSIGTILDIPGIHAALQATPAPVVGVSPIIGGAVVRGMADACLEVIGVPTSAAAVARLLGARGGAVDAVAGTAHPAREAGAQGVLDAWLVDEVDADAVAGLEAEGIRSAAVPLWLRDEPTGVQLVSDALALATS
ncbi:2-phospho-L-lactate transferase [Schumannella luteola]|uniref:LPPG:FO 2-phospho-L-lactate transferase n=1 Tax=Schumannella luteola TaxID=472059 RepID=A0A852Y961_9MICO|nr:LPPG:FO 2-phospho-L-lactate transferase [Schumannella luteola]TPX06324.1 2-phospho-L-lactate transferase [Schumannella luteola]